MVHKVLKYQIDKDLTNINHENKEYFYCFHITLKTN